MHGGMRIRPARTALQSKDGEGDPSLPVRVQPCLAGYRLDVVAVRNLQVLLDVVHMPLIQHGILVQISRSGRSEPLRGVQRSRNTFGVAAGSNTLWDSVEVVSIRG